MQLRALQGPTPWHPTGFREPPRMWWARRCVRVFGLVGALEPRFPAICELAGSTEHKAAPSSVPSTPSVGSDSKVGIFAGGGDTVTGLLGGPRAASRPQPWASCCCPSVQEAPCKLESQHSTFPAKADVTSRNSPQPLRTLERRAPVLPCFPRGRAHESGPPRNIQTTTGQKGGMTEPQGTP